MSLVLIILFFPITITGLTKVEFNALLFQTPSLRKTSYCPTVMLATFLFRMKNKASRKLVETVFGLQSFHLAARMINKAC